MLGPADDESLLVHQPPQAAGAEGDAGTLEQVRAEAGDAPDGEDVPAGQGAHAQGPPQLPPVLGRYQWGSPRARPVRQRTESALPPASADVGDGVEAQPGDAGDGGRLLPGPRQQQAHCPLDQTGRSRVVPELCKASPFPWPESDLQLSHGRILRPGVMPEPKDL